MLLTATAVYCPRRHTSLPPHAVVISISAAVIIHIRHRCLPSRWHQELITSFSSDGTTKETTQTGTSSILRGLAIPPPTYNEHCLAEAERVEGGRGGGEGEGGERESRSGGGGGGGGEVSTSDGEEAAGGGQRLHRCDDDDNQHGGGATSGSVVPAPRVGVGISGSPVPPRTPLTMMRSVMLSIGSRYSKCLIRGPILRSLFKREL